jgi:hypothetical protein
LPTHGAELVNGKELLVPQQNEGPAPARTGPKETLDHALSLVGDACARNGCALYEYHMQIAGERAAEAFEDGVDVGRALAAGEPARASAMAQHAVRCAEQVAARRVQHEAAPVADSWADVPVRVPGESTEVYATRWETYQRHGSAPRRTTVEQPAEDRLVAELAEALRNGTDVNIIAAHALRAGTPPTEVGAAVRRAQRQEATRG